MEVYYHTLKKGILRTQEFERKLLATHAVNVGLKCGHGCIYCSSPALLRCHRAFKMAGRSPFEDGYAIVDPNTAARVARDVRRFASNHTIMFCSTTDAWSPEAHHFNIGHDCLKILLEETLAMYTEHWMVYLGPILIIVVLFAKRGLFGLLTLKE